ncbi:MAG: GNAT family N-acetyltransferase [Candidatus Eremiobacteraeota bacterium]|nr:GNAT family N-acetyltransferase [Candidatus Eremiobacteraeota bacterium]
MIKRKNMRITIDDPETFGKIIGDCIYRVSSFIKFDDDERDEFINTFHFVLEHWLAKDEAGIDFGEITFIISIQEHALTVKIIDQGPPVNELDLGKHEGHYKNYLDNCRKAMSHARSHLNKVVMKNLGRKGRELILLKFVTYKDKTCNSFEKNDQKEIIHKYKGPIEIREMKTEEAGDLSRLVWEVYGRSYLYEMIYYPEKVVDLMKHKLLTPLVAVTDKGEILGVLSLTRDSSTPAICEIGQGMLAPSIRQRGIFSKLVKMTTNQAGKEGLSAVYAEAVAVHPHSQESCMREGLHETSLLLGYLSAEVDFGKLEDEDARGKRNAVLACFYMIKPPVSETIYVPGEHVQMVKKIYSQFGLAPNISTESCDFGEEEVASLELHTDKSEIKLARILIRNYSKRIDEQIFADLKQLQAEGFEVIWLDLPLNLPGTSTLTHKFEKIGFFFAGVLPHGGSPDGDILRFQYLNFDNVNLDLKIYSEFGKELSEYVLGEYGKYGK